MPCEIVHQVTRPDGPYGQAVIRSTCSKHGFSQYGVKLEAICPIGLIEAATEAALARIAGGVHGPACDVPADSDADPAPQPKRTRKAKAEPDA